MQIIGSNAVSPGDSGHNHAAAQMHDTGLDSLVLSDTSRMPTRCNGLGMGEMRIPGNASGQALAIETLRLWVESAVDSGARSAREEARDRMLAAGVQQTPIGLVIKGDLSLHCLKDLDCLPDCLPDCLHINGYLNLLGCQALEKLPDQLSVTGNLDLIYCKKLQTLPSALSVKGGIYISGCDHLATLPTGLSVGGKLYIADCPALMSLPDHITVGDTLHIFDCVHLQQLGKNTTITNTLYINRCPALSGLPEQLVVGKNLELFLCESISCLPQGMLVGGTLSLGDYRGLERDPQTLVDFAVQHLQQGGAPEKLVIKFLGLQRYESLMRAVNEIAQQFLQERQALLQQIENTDFDFLAYFSGKLHTNTNTNTNRLVLSEKAVEAVDALRHSLAYQRYTENKCIARWKSQSPTYFAVARCNNGGMLPSLPTDVEHSIRLMALSAGLRASEVPEPSNPC